MLIVALISGSLYLILQTIITWSWFRRIPLTHKSTPPVSVIIAARNEAQHLSACLHAVLEQDYPDFEVVLVLDRCSDRSASIAQTFAADKRLQTITIEELPADWTGKKWALTQGIAAAHNEHLVFTDADCTMGPDWLHQLMLQWNAETEVVLGIGQYRIYPGWLNRFIRFETFYAAFQYVGLTRLGMPYMAVGRNLAYTKSFFHQNRGFDAFKGRLSGDDDLLVNAYAHPQRTRVSISSAGHTWSAPKQTFREWLAQKRRHLSASNRYRLSSQVTLGLIHFSHMAFYAAILLAFVFSPTVGGAFALYILRVGISWIFFGIVNKKLQFHRLIAWYPILDLLFFVYNLSVVPAGIMTKPEWKK